MSLALEPGSLALVAAVAFAASLLGGVAGYGTGLLLPPVLVPLIGAEAVVPVISLSAVLTLGSRVAAYRTWLDWGLAVRVGSFALPGTVLSAWGFSTLEGNGAALVIGLTLLVLVPLRHCAMRMRLRLGPASLSLAGLGYGAVMGGTSASGPILLAMLVAAGLSGPAVLATDAAVHIVLATVKSATFFAAGSLPPDMILLALVIGLCAFPGAIIARRLTLRLGSRAHTAVLDGAVALGGLLLVWEGLR